MTGTLDHLRRLYANTDDPWNFAGSDYERRKFLATRDALSRDRYRTALEIGCGNGVLANHLAPRCARYFGLDAVERAVISARRRVPEAQFFNDCYPCPLPGDDFDLVVLSEVLYFLTPDAIARLSGDLAKCAPAAEVLCVTFLGDTQQALQGADALNLFRAGLQGRLDLDTVVDTGRYRIDRGWMRGTA